MKFDHDERVVMTLDAGGTNFVFSAVRANKLLLNPLQLPANGNDLQKCLETLQYGFRRIREQLEQEPVAISFSFPGPSDYRNGIIGDLVNLPAFRGGVAVGPMLERLFQLPVFINNDGDLYAYGEAIAGFLPEINNKLEKSGSRKRFSNLLGITLGTGFGAGIVRNGELFIGDNGAAAEIWPFPNKLFPDQSAEESISIRGLERSFAKFSGLVQVSSPKQIYQLAGDDQSPFQQAAKLTFIEFGECLGHALAYASSLIDGLIVIAGGLAGAAEFFLPATVAEMNQSLKLGDGTFIRRTEARVYNLDDQNELAEFLRGDPHTVQVPGTFLAIPYDPLKRVGIGTSRLGASEAMAIGAYAYALHEMDRAADV